MMKYNIKNDCRGMSEVDIFDAIMRSRGIKNIDDFLNPDESYLLPPLNNTNIVADRIISACENGDKILIWNDVDLDGVTSGTIITRFLYNFTPRDNIKTVINNGKAHGLIGQDIEFAYDFDLVIIVDSLDKDISQYKKLKEHNCDVIVIDHHEIKPNIPYSQYITLVSSQDNYDNKALSGAGCVWKVCHYIDEMLDSNYSDDLVDLAACGILGDVSDVSESHMENRYIVNMGLHNLKNPFIKKVVGSFPFNSTAVLFSVAPIINAANRTFMNEDAMKAFLVDDNSEVLKYKKILTNCKELQNEEVNRLMPDILKQIDVQKNKKLAVIFSKPKYGVNGLIGNKLLEMIKKPLLIINDCGDKYIGSMRAIGVEDFRKMINDTGLASSEGHPLAAGIEISKENFEEFCNVIEAKLPDTFEDEKQFDIDVRINAEDITRNLTELISSIDYISGQGFKPVKVYVDGITNYEIGNMSQGKHLVIKPNNYLWIIKWNFNGSFDDIEDSAMMNDEVRAVGELSSGWFGRTFCLKLVCDNLEVGK